MKFLEIVNDILSIGLATMCIFAILGIVTDIINDWRRR